MKTLTLVLLLAATLSAQRYPRSRGTSAATSPQPYKVTATFHGKLKELSKKEIVLENDDDQTVSIRRSGKTKFFKEDKEINPKDLDTETVITVDVSEDNDLKPTALKVTVDPNQKPKEKPELVKRATG